MSEQSLEGETAMGSYGRAEVNDAAADSGEPILEEQNQRFCMFPVKYRELWEMYKKAEASFWTGE